MTSGDLHAKNSQQRDIRYNIPMSQLFLASDIHVVAQHVAQNLPQNLTGRKTAFITTAAEPEAGKKQWMTDNKQGLVEAGFDLFDYTLTDKTPEDLENELGGADIIHVNGGNTFWLLLQARKSGFESFIRKHLESGKVYMGSSAGSLLAGPNIQIVETIDSNVAGDKLTDYTGLGLVDFIAMPHWGGADFRQGYLQNIATMYRPENKIILLNDYQYVHVIDGGYQIVDVRE